MVGVKETCTYCLLFAIIHVTRVAVFFLVFAIIHVDHCIIFFCLGCVSLVWCDGYVCCMIFIFGLFVLFRGGRHA
jgi:hypothetical protein